MNQTLQGNLNKTGVSKKGEKYRLRDIYLHNVPHVFVYMRKDVSFQEFPLHNSALLFSPNCHCSNSGSFPIFQLLK